MTALGASVSSGRNARRTGIVLLVLVTGFVLAYVGNNLTLRVVALALGAAAVIASLFWPRVLFWGLLVIVVLFNETSYAVDNPSPFILGRYRIPVLNIGVYDAIVFALFGVLILRIAITRRMVRLPRTVAAFGLACAAIVVLNVVWAMLNGVPYDQAYHPWGGAHLLGGVVALWSFMQLLDDEQRRLRVVDVLFVLAGGRALWALYQYIFGSGDLSNAYESAGVSKVAMWESAGHLLFTFLISAVLAAWLLNRVGRRRLLLWTAAALPMAAVILLSYRRTGWLGLLFALVMITIICLRRSQRALLVIPALGVTALAVSLLSLDRFRTGSGLVGRIFADVSSSGVTRQTEWGLAWHTISSHILLGAGPTGERLPSQPLFWDTRIVHNAALFVWLKFGLLGLLAATGLALSVGWYAFKSMMQSSRQDFIGIAVLALGPFLLLHAMSGTPLIEMRTVVLCALFGALAVSIGSRPREVTSAEERRRGETRGGAASAAQAWVAPSGRDRR